MRIVGGQFRGKTLLSPTTDATRPTSDRVREALFNVLQHGDYPDVDGARILDAFAGSGALGVEALSRGAAHVVFIDTASAAMDICKKNVAAIRAADKAQFISQPAHSFLKTTPPIPFDIIFLDPPYGQNLGGEVADVLRSRGWLHADSIIVVEMDKNRPEPISAHFDNIFQRTYGQTLILIIKQKPAAE